MSFSMLRLTFYKGGTYWMGGDRTYFVHGKTIGLGIQHNIDRKSLVSGLYYLTSGRVGGPLLQEIIPLHASCKLELPRFSAQLKIQDGAECGNIFPASVGSTWKNSNPCLTSYYLLSCFLLSFCFTHTYLFPYAS